METTKKKKKDNTLKSVMEKLNKEGFDGNIYIGGKDGNGFFYIGPYDTEAIQEKYDKCDASLREANKYAQEQIDKFLTQGMFRRDNLKKIGQNRKEQLKLKIDFIRQINALATRVEKLEHYEDNFESKIENVKVYQCYDKTDEKEPGKIILVEGCQKGEYWLLSEYEAKNQDAGDRKEA